VGAGVGGLGSIAGTVLGNAADRKRKDVARMREVERLVPKTLD